MAAYPHPLVSLAVFFGFWVVTVYFLGEYIAWMYREETGSKGRLPRHFQWFDRLERVYTPIENATYRITGIDPTREMTWRGFAVSFLIINGFLFVVVYAIVYFQGYLPEPLNPLDLPGQSWDLAYHTASSFTGNTNQQHYAGETLTAFAHMFAIGFAMFVAPATGLAVMPAFVRGFTNRENPYLGNFYVNFVKGLYRFLLPISFLVAIFLVSQGSPQMVPWAPGFDGQLVVQTIDGGLQHIRIQVHAGIESIKMLGTNGGGITSANAAHPFENPTPLTNLVLMLLMTGATFATMYAFGVWLGKRKHGVALVAVFAVIYFALMGGAVFAELQANQGMEVSAAGLTVDQSVGNMEGKEVRFGPVQSAIWGITTTSTNNGAVNSAHDSWTALGGLMLMFAFATNNVSSGLGTGILNIMMYVFVAVFIGALMIGRRPQYLGKKLEWREMRFVFFVLLFYPAIVLIPTAVAVTTEAVTAITNPAFHGFSQILYEMFSAAADNGSGFEGLADNTVFYNLVNGTQILLARFVPTILQLAIAGSLATKQISPETEGSLDIESVAFVGLTIGVVIIVSALVFLPALVFGPIGEMLSEGVVEPSNFPYDWSFNMVMPHWLIDIVRGGL